jgi:DNA-binding MarR family transcriptional regulator
MDRRLFFLINAAQHRMLKFADRRCDEELGISVTQAAAIMYVAKNEGCLQKDLAAAFGLNKPAITGLVGRMEKNGLIRRQPCEQDGRATRLYLSKLGQNKLPKIKQLTQTFNALLTQDFDEDEINTVIRFLNKIMDEFS